MHGLYLVTHPHAEHTEAGLVGGWHDSNLSERGLLDARLIAVELERRRGGKSRPLRITASDLARCSRTAEILAARLNAPVTLDPRLREISFGEADGRTIGWLNERQIPAPDDNRLDHRGPIPGAETRREVAMRVGECVAELMADREHDHVVITHGYAQIFVITSWLQIPVESTGFVSFTPSPGSIAHLTHDDLWRNRSVADLGNVSHLG